MECWVILPNHLGRRKKRKIEGSWKNKGQGDRRRTEEKRVESWKEGGNKFMKEGINVSMCSGKWKWKTKVCSHNWEATVILGGVFEWGR